jgi:hypothetical protein
MKTMAILASAALLTVCGAYSQTDHSEAMAGEQQQAARDNTAVTARDRGGNIVTAEDRSETEADRTLTQQIRRVIVADDSLSTNAKNVKVIQLEVAAR